MSSLDTASNQLSLAPLGPGDLIDRAVRFYRKFFWTFVLIAAPPVLISTVISVTWTILGREMFNVRAGDLSVESTLYYLFLWLGTLVIWLAETIATLAVMGGASRNFVRHLLFGEAITVRETYRNTWQRLGSLVAASAFMTLLLGFLGLFIFYFAMFLAVLAIALVFAAFEFLPIAAFILAVLIGLVIGFGALWLFFLAASRLAFVPQVMLVEGQGVFSAIGRSATLAGGSVRRLAALFVFTTVAAYSALALLYVPLAWYASANGVQLMTFDADLVPAWYEIAYNLIWQISFILLSPVWMVGLCLLYVDERVRSEGYDLELMAAARLGSIPAVPSAYSNPLQPALADFAAIRSSDVAAAGKDPYSTLGLR
jgi:hypothetical protein